MSLTSLYHSRRFHRFFIFGLGILFLLTVGGIFLLASVPPVCRDGLTHHLALPKLYLKHGGIVELPDIPFSYYPMNLDLLYLAALYMGNDIIPKYIHMLFGILTAGLIYRYLNCRMGVALGMMGALLWMSTPIVIRLASEVYVDLGVAFFGFASVVMLIRWVESDFKLRYLVYSGALCGLALGTKYNALLILTILSLIVPFLRSRTFSTAMVSQGGISNCLSKSVASDPTCTNKRGALKSIVFAAVCFTGISLAVFSPWMIRNWVLKQNPIYPMFKSIFTSEEAAVNQWNLTSTMVQDTTGSMSIRHLVYKESLGYMAMVPLRIFFEGRDDSPRHFDGRLNPYLLVFSIVGFIPFGIISERLRRDHQLWLWFAVLFMLMAFFTAPIRIRYVVPALPAIVILAMIGIYRCWNGVAQLRSSAIKFILKASISMAAFFMFVYNANYFIERYQKVQPLEYLRGFVSRDEYISERRPEYPVVRYINANLPKDSFILALFLGERRYYFDRDVLFNEGILKSSLRTGAKPDEVLSEIRGFGITHLMIRADLFNNWVINSLTDDERTALKKFWEKYVRFKIDKNGFFLFEI